MLVAQDRHPRPRCGMACGHLTITFAKLKIFFENLMLPCAVHQDHYDNPMQRGAVPHTHQRDDAAPLTSGLLWGRARPEHAEWRRLCGCPHDADDVHYRLHISSSGLGLSVCRLKRCDSCAIWSAGQKGCGIYGPGGDKRILDGTRYDAARSRLLGHVS